MDFTNDAIVEASAICEDFHRCLRLAAVGRAVDRGAEAVEVEDIHEVFNLLISLGFRRDAMEVAQELSKMGRQVLDRGLSEEQPV